MTIPICFVNGTFRLGSWALEGRHFEMLGWRGSKQAAVFMMRREL
jgi:hypothetical protein